MNSSEARRRFATARVARLATVDAAGRPHLVPMVFAVSGDVIYSAVDDKPKRTRALRRLANVANNSSVCLLVDEYDDEDWTRLWWARADGSAEVVEPSSRAGRRGISCLRDRYAQYAERAPEGPVVVVTVARWSGWEAARARP